MRRKTLNTGFECAINILIRQINQLLYQGE